VITIPNAQFLTLQVENLQERDRILFNTTLRLRYETAPDQLRWILVRVRALLDTHPRLDPDSSRVRFSGFGASSLDVELFVYVRTRDYGDFLAVREDLCLRVMDVVTTAGTAFALPAQTNYSAPPVSTPSGPARRSPRSSAGAARASCPCRSSPSRRDRDSGSLAFLTLA
jgi:MscS family membrane protein